MGGGSLYIDRVAMDGEPVRLYRRAQARRGMLFGGLLIFGISTVRIVSAFTEGTRGLGGAIWPIVILVLVYATLVVGFFWMSRRFGIETTKDGIRSIGASGTAYVAWNDVQSFTVGSYATLSSCVMAELRDRKRIALKGIATWSYMSYTLRPYCDALTRELEEHRSTA